MNIQEYLLYLLTHYHQLSAEAKQASLLKEGAEKTMFLSRAQELERLRYALSGILPKHRAVIQDLYFHQETWQAISEKYHISQKTIAQYRKKGLEQLISIWELSALKKLSTQKDAGII